MTAIRAAAMKKLIRTVRLPFILVPIEVTLQDQHGCHFIHVSPPFAPIQSHFFELLLGGETRQAFIPHHYRYLNCLFQFPGKFSGFATLRAGLAVHVQGLADDDFMDFVLLNEAAQTLDIDIDTAPLDSRYALWDQKHSVTDRDANGLVSDIKCHDSHVSLPLSILHWYNLDYLCN